MTLMTLEGIARTCTWPDGCNQKHGLKLNEAGEPRCQHHDPERQAKRQAKQRATILKRRMKGGGQVVAAPGELPITEIKSPADAVLLARWLPVAIATGKIGGREAQAVIQGLKEYRMAYADVDSARRLRELEERILAARKRGLDV